MDGSLLCVQKRLFQNHGNDLASNFFIVNIVPSAWLFHLFLHSSFRWTKDGGEFDPGTDPELKVLERPGSFAFFSLGNNMDSLKQYQAKYVCFASNELGTAVSNEAKLNTDGKNMAIQLNCFQTNSFTLEELRAFCRCPFQGLSTCKHCQGAERCCCFFPALTEWFTMLPAQPAYKPFPWPASHRAHLLEDGGLHRENNMMLSTHAHINTRTHAHAPWAKVKSTSVYPSTCATGSLPSDLHPSQFPWQRFPQKRFWAGVMWSTLRFLLWGYQRWAGGSRGRGKETLITNQIILKGLRQPAAFSHASPLLNWISEGYSLSTALRVFSWLLGSVVSGNKCNMITSMRMIINAKVCVCLRIAMKEDLCFVFPPFSSPLPAERKEG